MKFVVAGCCCCFHLMIMSFSLSRRHFVWVEKTRLSIHLLQSESFQCSMKGSFLWVQTMTTTRVNLVVTLAKMTSEVCLGAMLAAGIGTASRNFTQQFL